MREKNKIKKIDVKQIAEVNIIIKIKEGT